MLKEKSAQCDVESWTKGRRWDFKTLGMNWLCHLDKVSRATAVNWRSAVKFTPN